MTLLRTVRCSKCGCEIPASQELCRKCEEIEKESKKVKEILG